VAATPTAQDLRVVYTNDGNLWIVEGEKPPRQLTFSGGDGDPLFSPDGRWILFQRALPPVLLDLPRFELRVIGADGGGERQLVGPEDLPGVMGEPPGSSEPVQFDRQPLQIVWLPDSHTVAFNTTVGVTWGTAHHDDLWLIDIETRELSRLLPDGEGGAFAFSPDASHLLVSTSTAVAMLDAGGGNRRTLLTFESVATYSEYAYHPMPVWSPDGSYALVAVSSPDPLEPGAGADLWRLSLSGDATLLGTLTGDLIHNSQHDALWSPDRARLAYTVAVAGDDPNARDLVVADADGGNPVVYASGKPRLLGWDNTGEPSVQTWTPDSQRFVYWQDQDLSGALLLGQPGEPATPLSPPEGIGPVLSLRWADANSFAFVAGEQEAYVLGIGQAGGAWRVIGASDDALVQLDVLR
jgi:dipeptidyl aminopeptidase/acylaminoacyl peptidase